MATFEDSDQLYRVIDTLFERISADPEMAGPMLKGDMVIRFNYRDPEDTPREIRLASSRKSPAPLSAQGLVPGPCADRVGIMGTLKASWTVEIEAPRERCYEIAADIENAPEWQKTLEEVEVLERDGEGRALVVETVSDAVVKKARSQLRFSYDPPGGLSWEQEEGDPKWLTGSWELVDLDGKRTKATYGLEADPGRVLNMLLRGPIKDKVKEHVTRSAAEGLKEQAEKGK